MAIMKPRGFLLCIAAVAFLFVIHQSDPHHRVFASNFAKGFSLKLNHHFPHQNLTFEERYSRYRRATEARAASFSKAMGLNPLSEFAENDGQQIYPGVFVEGPYYTVDLQIGGENPRHLELLLDTGSPLSWTQCSSCTTCFPQVGEIYNPRNSRSYKILPLNDQYCRIQAPPGPQGRRCDYKMRYGSNDGPVTIGYLGRDTFSFLAKGGRSAVHVPEVLFGCSEDSRNFGSWETASHGYIAGILGMDQSPISMINQLNHIRGYRARFSYCLRKPGLIGQRIYSFLRVGDDIPMTGSGNIQRTPLIRYGNGFHYFANLVGVSVNGHLVRVQGNGIGGGRKPATTNPINTLIMIDSGAPGTILLQPLFNAVANAVDAALAPFKLVKLTTCPYVLCYRLPKAVFLSQLPSVEYHFVGGAVLPVISESVFSINVQEKYFMLTMVPGDINILGARHQQDVHVLYDLEAKQLSWISADCSKDV